MRQRAQQLTIEIADGVYVLEERLVEPDQRRVRVGLVGEEVAGPGEARRVGGIEAEMRELGVVLRRVVPTADLGIGIDLANPDRSSLPPEPR